MREAGLRQSVCHLSGICHLKSFHIARPSNTFEMDLNNSKEQKTPLCTQGISFHCYFGDFYYSSALGTCKHTGEARLPEMLSVTHRLLLCMSPNLRMYNTPREYSPSHLGLRLSGSVLCNPNHTDCCVICITYLTA